MPVQPTYPGVYTERIPSGVRAITGVATSITAFIGRAYMGPVNEPTIINNYGDYERAFGGLWLDSTMSYAVRDFYLNGGSQAVIIRIINGATSAAFQLPTEVSPTVMVELEAKNEGTWANGITITVNHDVGDPLAPTSPPPPQDTESFNLQIFMGETQVEEFLLVSMNPNAVRYLPRVLEQSSAYLQVSDSNTATDRPAATANAGPTTDGGNGSAPGTNDYLGTENAGTGLYALNGVDLFNLLCIPPPTRSGDTHSSVYAQALSICVAKRAILLVDPPIAWGNASSSAQATAAAISGLNSLGVSGTDARNAALYFPRVRQSDPLRDGQVDTFVPCGIMAGVIAKTDTNRGVWKSPAGTDAGLSGIQGLQTKLTDDQNGQLNPLGINCLRTFPIINSVSWGARTMRGADVLADEYKYLSVQRLAMYIEESLSRGLKWVVFEPNDEPLWAQIRLNAGAFMQNLFRQGAFQGSTPKQAYLVKCDSETTTQNDINLGIVNILVGFAPLKPAEFVIIKLQLLAGETNS